MKWDEDQPRSKRLLTDENSNIFIYLTGHGGNEFLKFQDAEEIGSYDIADAFEQMHEKKRYNEIFFMIDTCQANTMYERFYSPNILAVGSSRLDESSYSHHSDLEIGVAVIDRFTYYTLEFLEKLDKNSNLTLDKLFDEYTFENVHSNPGIRTDLFHRDPKKVLLTDFFGNVHNVVVDVKDDDLLYAANHNEDGIRVSVATPKIQVTNNTTSNKTMGTLKFGSRDNEESQNLINLEPKTMLMISFITVIVFIGLWFATAFAKVT
ncbi:glycosylphosphatidylinositol anchor biosynthesis [Scheffersomyces spartinae]|uniref:Glycosylphosphatidylinositol anchor biosynthesis n=1 Tax=Scheffersomyces spartinae TaxID=45513 RepID=A0A9P7VCG5_9ASCO|nr:glycosylphosphatidylinositol anchor biosynthesis [Scheffersomyces spartinae]KAG7195322.1 glycosylphosphatidylinositol anchor biosynthesis [Scheffersomyces spartinae]